MSIFLFKASSSAYFTSTILLFIEAGVLAMGGIYDQLSFLLIIGASILIGVIGYLYAMLYVEYLVDKTEAASLLKNN